MSKLKVQGSNCILSQSLSTVYVIFQKKKKSLETTLTNGYGGVSTSWPEVCSAAKRRRFVRSVKPERLLPQSPRSLRRPRAERADLRRLPLPIAATAAAMWRSSLSFSSARKLLSSSLSSPSSSTNHSFYSVATRPLQSLSGSSSSPSAAAPPSHPNPPVAATSGVGLIGRADGVRGFASSSSAAVAAAAAAAFDVSALASSRARDAVDLARHYGRCYWELSKARLR